MTDTHYRDRAQSAAAVVANIRNGQHVFVHGAAATPLPLLQALQERRELEDVQLYHLHLSGGISFSDPTHGRGLFSNSLFTGPGQRGPVERGEAEYVPVFLSDIPRLFRSRRVPLDAALLQLSPPDAHGNCTLGVSVDAAKAAAESATLLLAEINEQMPRTHGNSVVPLSRLHAYTVSNRPLPEATIEPAGPVEQRIGQLIADLVSDGSTLQIGVGAIPNAVLERLTTKNDLGVHTETFSDGLIPLIEAGVITNCQKDVHRGRIVTSFVAGTRRVYDYVHDNAVVEFHPCDRTNDSALIRQNPRTCAINSALEVDLSGQVCADSIGARIFSGIGGQMDFIRGAAESEDGKPIIALPSTAAGGKLSRIVTMLKPGAGVVTTRGHVHYVVTEYGAVNLHGRNLRQRADALISIAHPDFRAELRNEINGLRHFSL